MDLYSYDLCLKMLTSGGRVSTDLSFRASQAFTEDQLLLLQPGATVLCVPLWFCVIQGTFWVTHERRREREKCAVISPRVHVAVRYSPLIRGNQYHGASWDEKSRVVTGLNGKDKEGWRGSNGAGWVTGSRKVDTRRGVRGHLKRMHSRMHRAAGRVKERDEREKRKLYPVRNKGKVSLCLYLDSQVERGRRPARDTQRAGSSPERQRDKETERETMDE